MIITTIPEFCVQLRMCGPPHAALAARPGPGLIAKILLAGKSVARVLKVIGHFILVLV